MIRLLIPIILIALAIVLARRYINNGPGEERGSRQTNIILLVIIILLLAITFVRHVLWLGALVSGVIVVARKLMTFLSTHSSSNSSSSKNSSSANASNSEEEEAIKILGLQKPYTREDVIEAHRKLMQKFHPDRGGNDYLAATINEAKELLLKNL